MTEYQVVFVRLHGRSGDDEESVTDLLNERARMGWRCHSVSAVEPGKLLVVFTRDA